MHIVLTVYNTIFIFFICYEKNRLRVGATLFYVTQ